MLAQAPPNTDRTLWLYELCRFLISQCNSLIVGFLFDTPPCSAVTCPEMRASEWQFLCAVHEQPRSCCAIDYCCHTLDWAANVVTNPKIFPSRFLFADAHDKNAAIKNLVNVFRRLHRIFAHAWFQHRGVFWSVEGQTGLYVFFKTVCDMYDLLPAENYKLPPEAEGLDTASSLPPATSSGAGHAAGNTGGADAVAVGASESTPGLIPVAAISDRKSLGFAASPAGNLSAAGSSHRVGSGHVSTGSGGAVAGDDSEHVHSVGRTKTQRHIRSSPSTGSAVPTVLEQDEDAGAASLPSAVPLSSSGGRPISIIQNSHAAPISSGSAAATTHSHSPPSVTERKVAGDEGQDAAAAEGSNVSGAGDEEETAEVPVIVQDDPQLWTPIASSATAGPTTPAGVPLDEQLAAVEAPETPEAAERAEVAETESVPVIVTPAEEEEEPTGVQPTAVDAADEKTSVLVPEPAAAEELKEGEVGASVGGVDGAADSEDADAVKEASKDEESTEADATADVASAAEAEPAAVSADKAKTEDDGAAAGGNKETAKDAAPATDD